MRLGIAGFPITHSLSPLMFRAAFEETGITGTYETIECKPIDFPGLLQQLKAEGYRGLNITSPLKSLAMQHVDQPSPLASRLSATNLVILEENQIESDNTDVYGFTNAIRKSDLPIDECVILICGAGGAARACVMALAELGIHTVTLATRFPSRIQQWNSPIPVEIIQWNERNRCFADSGKLCVINATPLGWRANDELPYPVDNLSNVSIAIDLNYPTNNTWLAEMGNKGVRVMDGLPMLLYQAVLGFERFTGREAPVEIMFQALKEAHR